MFQDASPVGGCRTRAAYRRPSSFWVASARDQVSRFAVRRILSNFAVKKCRLTGRRQLKDVQEGVRNHDSIHNEIHQLTCMEVTLSGPQIKRIPTCQCSYASFVPAFKRSDRKGPPNQ